MDMKKVEKKCIQRDQINALFFTWKQRLFTKFYLPK